MNHHEEKLQKKIEDQEVPAGDTADERAYEAVFRALRREPPYQLPPEFARRVTAKLAARAESRDAKDYIWFAAGIGFLIASFIGTLFFTGVRFDLGFLKEMSGYKGLVLFGVAFITILNWLDRKFLRHETRQP